MLATEHAKSHLSCSAGAWGLRLRGPGFSGGCNSSGGIALKHCGQIRVMLLKVPLHHRLNRDAQKGIFVIVVKLGA